MYNTYISWTKAPNQIQMRQKRKSCRAKIGDHLFVLLFETDDDAPL